MSNEPKCRGEVIERLPNNTYRVQIDDGPEVLCYVAGKVQRANVSITIGDRVEVILDPYKGKATNRIVWRI